MAEKAELPSPTTQIKKRLVSETIKVKDSAEAIKILGVLIKKHPIDNFSFNEFPEYSKGGKPTGKIKRELSVRYKTDVPVTEAIIKWYMEKEGL